jgi:hypothetical protein
VEGLAMMFSVRSVVTLTAFYVITCTSSAHAQEYVATELSGGGSVLNSVYVDPGWFVDVMNSLTPVVGVVGEASGYYGSGGQLQRPFEAYDVAGGIRLRFPKNGPSLFVQLLFGERFYGFGATTMTVRPGAGITLPFGDNWAVRIRADVHVESEGAASAFGVGLTRQWGRR